MTQIVLLNNVDHQDLRVIAGRGGQYGDNVMVCATFPSEFRDVQANYPIVFRRTDGDPDSDFGAGFEPLALFGFQEGENLFLGPNGWDANHVPMAIERLPFLIGRSGEQIHVHIDIDSPRISRAAGEALFLPFGGVSPYLERINSMLLAIHEGLQQTASLIGALREHDLLEPFVVDVELADGSPHRLHGFHTINEDKLLALAGDALERLNRAGHLQSIYMVLASLSNFRDLIARKQRAVSAHG